MEVVTAVGDELAAADVSADLSVFTAQAVEVNRSAMERRNERDIVIVWFDVGCERCR